MTQTPADTRPGIEIAIGNADWRRFDAHVVTVGRAESAMVRLDDPRVSRCHAQIVATPQGWVIEDVQSGNGTYLSGGRIQRLPINGPLEVHLGAPDGPMVRLRSSAGTQAHESASQRRWPLGTRLCLGRASSNDVVLDDLLTSRHHAVIGATNDQAWIVDLGSGNGTFVNETPITRRTPLTHGDVIALGHTRLALEGTWLVELPPPVVVLQACGVGVVTPEGKWLLRHVGLELTKRQLIAVVGPSGAGKTTLMHALIGQRPADEGQVLVGGRNLARCYAEVRAQVGFVPQDDIVHPQLTPRQELMYAAELRLANDTSPQEQRQRVQEVLAELDLTNSADVPIARLSGGQRKRVNVGLELLSRPPLLLLDEPTSGLDPGHDKQLMQLLRLLADGDRAVVVVTHNIAHLDVCNEVLVLAPGGHTAFRGAPPLTLAHFGVSEFADVFLYLERAGRDAWEPCAACGDNSIRTTQPVTTTDGGYRNPSRSLLSPPARRRTGIRQITVLVRRYVAILRADRRNVGILLAQAPLLGLLVRAIGSDAGLSASVGQVNDKAQRVISTLVLAITWLGASNAVREIVKERALQRRERAIGVRIWAYIGAKVVVLACLTTMQALMLLIVVTAGRPLPHQGAMLPVGPAELLIDVCLAGCAGMATGLLISALVTNADKALSLLPLLLVPQLILCGGVIALDDAPSLRALSYLASARWGVSAAASTVDLEGLRRPPSTPSTATASCLAKTPTADPSWKHTDMAWVGNVGVLGAMSIGCLTAAALSLALSDGRGRRRQTQRRRPR
ncbi:MAG: transport system ATP-binding/permease protein [Actinomycetota bacterium]|nr:transport system ATP-binding/permease protein [Actinomycetota bacterium]